MSDSTVAHISQGINLQQLREALTDKNVGYVVLPSRKEAGSTVVYLQDRRIRGNLILAVGEPGAPPSSNPRFVTQPNPPKSNPDSKMLIALLGVAESDQDNLAWVINKLYELAVEQAILGPGVDTVKKMRESLKLPFSVPDAEGKGDYGIWIRVQTVAPRPTLEKLRTVVTVHTRGADGSVTIEKGREHEYNPQFLIRDMHAPSLIELGEISAYNGTHSMNASARWISIDAEEAITDPSYVRPVATSSRSKAGVYFPWTGGVVAFDGEKYPEPTFLPEGTNLAGLTPVVTSEDLASRCDAKQISLDVREEVARDGKINARYPPGSKRVFVNDVSSKGNIMAFEGDFLAPAETQPYFGKLPHLHHKSAADSKTYAALLVLKDPIRAAGHRRFKNFLYQEIIDKNIVSRKRISMDVAKVSAVLPGLDPEDDEDAGVEGGAEGEVGRAKNFCLYLKLQMEPPKDIVDLQTKFYIISDPSEPFSVERVSGYDLPGGRSAAIYYEYSELQMDLTPARMVMYVKYVFLSKNSTGGGGSVPQTLQWGGVSLKIGNVDEAGETTANEGANEGANDSEFTVDSETPSQAKRARVQINESSNV